jgi:Ca2+-binding EF-hand superfamily protein
MRKVTANSHQNNNGPLTSIKLNDLENLFIDKLSEKYRLNERDLGKAFKKFDLDGSGFLDLNELTKAINMFIPGIAYSSGIQTYLY